MIEIEAKMKLQDRRALERKLCQVSGYPVEQIFETNTFFDTGKRELRRQDRGLRVRVSQVTGGPRSVTITHKGPRTPGPLKTRRETEVVVENTDAASEFLVALGYEAVLSFQKRRDRWMLNDCRVELDTLPYLGYFVEIEGPDEQTVLAVRQMLELQEAPLIHTSYSAMIARHIRENRLQTNEICFEPDPHHS